VVHPLTDDLAAAAQREHGRVVALSEVRRRQRLARQGRPRRDDHLDEVLLVPFGLFQLVLVDGHVRHHVEPLRAQQFD